MGSSQHQTQRLTNYIFLKFICEYRPEKYQIGASTNSAGEGTVSECEGIGLLISKSHKEPKTFPLMQAVRLLREICVNVCMYVYMRMQYSFIKSSTTCKSFTCCAGPKLEKKGWCQTAGEPQLHQTKFCICSEQVAFKPPLLCWENGSSQ